MSDKRAEILRELQEINNRCAVKGWSEDDRSEYDRAFSKLMDTPQ